MTAQPALSPDTWKAFEANLRNYVRRRVDTASADDVVGDIMLRLVQHQGALTAADKPLAWMRRVAANAVADHYRRRSVERRALADLKDDGGETESPDRSASEELASCLMPMIRELPAPYSEALLMTDIAGLTQAEAAARLGLSLSGMKSRVQRGRAKLKQTVLRCCAVQVDRRGGVMDCEPRAGGRRC